MIKVLLCFVNSSWNSGNSINKLRLEQHISIIKHSILKWHYDKLKVKKKKLKITSKAHVSFITETIVHIAPNIWKKFRNSTIHFNFFFTCFNWVLPAKLRIFYRIPQTDGTTGVNGSGKDMDWKHMVGYESLHSDGGTLPYIYKRFCSVLLSWRSMLYFSWGHFVAAINCTKCRDFVYRKINECFVKKGKYFKDVFWRPK